MSRTESALSNGNAPAGAAAATADSASAAVKGCGASLPSSTTLTEVDILEQVEQTVRSRRSSLHDLPRDQTSPPASLASTKTRDCAGAGVDFQHGHESAGDSPSSHLSPITQGHESMTAASSGSENMKVVDDAAERRSSSAKGAASSPTPSASSQLTSPDDGAIPSPRLTAYDTPKAPGSTTPNEKCTPSKPGESHEQEEKRGMQLRSFQQFQVPNPPDLPQHPSHADWIAANHDDPTASSIKEDVRDKPFQCDDCGNAFARKSDLLRHSHIHSNIRQPRSPFVCSFPGCEKDFIQRSALTVHFRVHTGERPHVCGHLSCGKAFSDSSSLARHRRTHTGAKPFQCEVPDCGKKFCRKITLTKHVRREHVPGGRLPRYRGGSARRKLRSGPYNEHQSFDDTAHHIRTTERLLGWHSRSLVGDERQDDASGSLGRDDLGIDASHRTRHVKGRATGAEDHGCSRESTFTLGQSSRHSQSLPEYPDQPLSPYDPPSVGAPREDSLSHQLQVSALATSCAILPVHPQLASLQAFYMESLGAYPQQAQASIDYESRVPVAYHSTARGSSSSSSFSSSCDTMGGQFQERHDGHEPHLQWAQHSQSLRYHGACDEVEYANFNATLPTYPSSSSLSHTSSAELSRGPTPDSFGAGSDPMSTFRRYPTWPPSVNLKVHPQQDSRSSTHFYGDDSSSHAPAWINPALGVDVEESRNGAAQSNVLDDHSTPRYSLDRGLWGANSSTRRLSTIPLPDAESSLALDDGRLGGELREEGAPPSEALYATSSVIGGVSIEDRGNLANFGVTRGRVSV